ncbi:hypothetical protein [Sphingomonas xinjiangensis]|uniref:Uncharacterized protein n=1 Tax=Sphingomonas xinjiangensis TaxID=643568 RepID=A0A840YLV5_9SPHN|nr:hypothetical protein [Sphingomonas xinjiangensis]MBB5710556.1 hypothetical protein [Sphingomonas xinjiangensis]
MGISDLAGIGARKAISGKSFMCRNPHPSKAEQVIAEFRKEAKKTPMERLRDNILKRHNMTQEQFDALSPELKAPIQREIEEAMRRAVKGGRDGSAHAGTNANVLA